MNVRFFLSYHDIEITSKLHFWCENVKILSLYRHCCCGHHYNRLLNMEIC